LIDEGVNLLPCPSTIHINLLFVTRTVETFNKEYNLNIGARNNMSGITKEEKHKYQIIVSDK